MRYGVWVRGHGQRLEVIGRGQYQNQSSGGGDQQRYEIVRGLFGVRRTHIHVGTVESLYICVSRTRCPHSALGSDTPISVVLHDYTRVWQLQRLRSSSAVLLARAHALMTRELLCGDRESVTCLHPPLHYPITRRPAKFAYWRARRPHRARGGRVAPGARPPARSGRVAGRGSAARAPATPTSSLRGVQSTPTLRSVTHRFRRHHQPLHTCTYRTNPYLGIPIPRHPQPSPAWLNEMSHKC